MREEGTNIEDSNLSGRERLQAGSQFPEYLDSIITSLAESVQSDEFGTGNRIQLTRMDYNAPDAPFFWQLISEEGMPRHSDIAKWALIVKGIAQMAYGSGTAHRSGTPVGRTLYLGGGHLPFGRSYYSEQRLAALLSARGPALLNHLDRLFRLLAKDGCSFDWREMAWFILSESCDEKAAYETRAQIARDYYRARWLRLQQIQH
ncbi:MAG: type I-E CRISPR-associated protein Cse2/CasB [Chloroflexota bacterium]|nr:type I-E CRISPR-associated protein Cse2/CasB [Chloroflexota bacterium]